MTPRHQVSRAAIDLIKRFEGFRRKAAQLPDGRWTIGYGHTQTARAGAQVSESDAEALLMYDLIAVAHAVNEQVFTPLTQNQFDALAAFAFNIGLDSFRGSSVLRRVNAGELLQAALGMELWRRVEFEGEPIVVDALVRRRAAEKTLFLTPAGGWQPAPSAVLRPILDADLLGLVPVAPPTALEVPLDGEKVVVLRPDLPPRPVADSPASPAQAAAAAVTARLQTIFAEPEPEPMPIDEPEPFPDTAKAANSGGRTYTASPPQAAAPLSAPARPVGANESEPGIFVRPASSLAHVAPPRTDRREMLQILGLGAAGLGLFAWALFWAFNARMGQEQGLLNPVVVSWVMGVVGVGAFGLAAYLVLERLGRNDDDDLPPLRL
jgi:lysozyme